MLTFVDAVLKEVRKLQNDTEALVLGGGIPDMERYKFLMGRLEGLRMVEDATKELVKKYQTDDDD